MTCEKCEKTCEKQQKVNNVKNEKMYSFVFAFHPNGANDFQAIKGKNKKEKNEIMLNSQSANVRHWGGAGLFPQELMI